MTVPEKQTFFAALGLRRGDVVSIVGAGGKTSLLLRLAAEARSMGLKVLVTTSTRMLVPEPEFYDAIDLSGNLFTKMEVSEPGVYIGGTPDSAAGKMRGVHEELLRWQQRRFDLVLIEADGAACKPLKAWRSGEPVVVDFTTATIGVLDIQTLDQTVSEGLVHRLEIFSALTGADPDETLRLGHLLRLITHQEGLFAKALGRELLLVNKVESEGQLRQARLLASQLENLHIVMGSVARGTIHA